MKTVFKRLISSLLLVVMLVAMIPASIVSAGADDIDWEALKNKYGLTDEQIDAAKDIADEYDLTQEQVDAVEDYYESLPPEEQEELKVTVKDAVEKGEMPELGSVGGDVATNMVKAMFIATLKKAAKDVLNRVMDAMEDVTVTNVFGFDRVYDNGSLAGINFVLKSPETLNVLDTVQLLADRYSVMDALALVAGAVLMFDEVSVNGYTVYDLTDPSEVRNALVEIYRANPIEFNTIATMEGNVVATYNFSLAVGGLAIDLPVSFVLECSDARLSQIKSTAKKLADRVEVNGDFSEEDGVFSADLEGVLDVSDFTDEILESLLPAVLADEYALVREQLHAMTLNDFIDQLKLENLEIAADKLGYSAQFDALVAKIAGYFHLNTAEPNDLKALANLIDAKGLLPLYIKVRLQKADTALQLSEKLNVTFGDIYNGDGTYSFTLGNGINPVGFDSLMDRAFEKLLNNKYEDRIENALKTRGYATAEDLVNALKARYNKIYTGKYDLDVSFTLVLFKTYTVTFKDEDGNVLSTQKVVAGDGAADPVYHGGNVLNINYATYDNYDKVMGNMTVTLYPLHTLKVEYIPDADCLNDGVKRTYCTVSGCDYEVLERVPAHGHDYDAIVTAPTCTEEGYTTYVCAICGDSYKDDFVKALGHDWSDWFTVQLATEAHCGEEVRKCYSCGVTEKRYFGHNYDAVVTPPTCTEDGYTTYTCTVCNVSYKSDYVAALGHDYVEVDRVASTCSVPGYVSYVCSRCGDTNTSALPLAAHSWGALDILDPTCTEDGYRRTVCDVCGFVREVILPATGHDLLFCGILHDATCMHPGLEMHICMTCLAEIEVYVNRNDNAHSYETKVVYEAGCNTVGLKIHTCIFCGYVETEVVPALGHAWDIKNGVYVAPTCNSTGSWTFTCDRCGEIHVVDLDITDHVYTTVHVEGTSCCNPTVDYEQCIYCGAIGNSVETPVVRPTINQVTTNVAYVAPFVFVKADKMTLGEFKTNFYGDITVYNKNGEAMFDSEYIGTASTLVCDGCGAEFTIAVVGDVNGDGKLNSLDYVYIKRDVLNRDTLTGAMMAAADVNVDCKINSIDYAMLKKHLMYRYNIYENLPTWEEIEKNGLVTDDIRG